MIVSYVLISTGEDIYTEQALMSIWSCRYYNPDLEIIIITDENTSKVIDSYTQIRELVNDIKVIKFDNNYSNFEKSRILKTKLRQILRGELLFVDTDTIFCGSIDENDFLVENIGMVEDIHVKNIEIHPFGHGIKSRVDKLFNIDIRKDLPYYNSGVIFYKDNPVAEMFSREWYDNWKKVKEKEGGKFDQPSLLYTLSNNLNVIEPLKGIYNVQVLGSVRYLFSGKILHFFNANWGRDSVHPFLDRKYYMTIKEKKGLTTQHKDDILNCKNLFSPTSFIIGPDDVPVWVSLEVSLLKRMWTSKITRCIVRYWLLISNKTLLIKDKLLKSIQK